jgi:hypothetical protein
MLLSMKQPDKSVVVAVVKGLVVVVKAVVTDVVDGVVVASVVFVTVLKVVVKDVVAVAVEAVVIFNVELALNRGGNGDVCCFTPETPFVFKNKSKLRMKVNG